MSRLRQNQHGIASILITIILVLVIGLILYSFVEISRSNQSEALVSQLGAQAYDAADTGINVARRIILNDFNVSSTPSNATSCTDLADQAKYLNRVGNTTVLDNNGNVTVTCLLVNTEPTDLKATSVPVGKSIVWKLDPDLTSSQIQSLTFDWSGNGPPGSPNNCPTNFGSFPTQATYITNCNIPMLQVDIFQDLPSATPGGPFSGGSTSPTKLNLYTLNLFLQPTCAAGVGSCPPSNYISKPNISNDLASNYFSANTFSGSGGAANPRIVQCVAGSSSCSATVNFSSQAPLGTVYYLRIATLYGSASSVQVIPGPGTIKLVKSQIVIDATAKDRNVVRRIQERFPYPDNGTSTLLPNNAIETNNSVCKDLSIIPPNETDACISDN